MFTSLTLFRIEGPWPGTAEELATAAQAEAFAPCSTTQQKATGWAPPRTGCDPLIENVAGQLIGRFVIETKAVPADALRRRVDELAQQIEATTGRVPGKREKKDLRDDALQELLPHAFPKQSACFVWIDPETRLLAVDASSMGKVDEITASLTRIAAPGFGLQLIQTQSTPQSVMAHWLGGQDGDTMPASLSLGRSCVLQGGGEEPARVKFDKHDLSTTEVRQHLADGKLPIALTMDYEDRVRFTLTDGLMLKGIAFDDAVFADVGDDADRFDTDVTIKTAELQDLIAELLKALGGEHVAH